MAALVIANASPGVADLPGVQAGHLAQQSVGADAVPAAVGPGCSQGDDLEFTGVELAGADRVRSLNERPRLIADRPDPCKCKPIRWALLGLLFDEGAAQRPGRQDVLNRLFEVVLTDVLGVAVVNTDGSSDGGELFALAGGVWVSCALPP